MQNIIGWDVGGAHLKAARVEDGVITKAAQIACPLWLGLGELDRAFFAAEAAIGRAPLNAITMTGECCDAFATREEGVVGLAAIMVRLLSP
ncbi:MAG: hydantoinase/oxoprolinase family protein, partial [Methylocella sp.]